MKPFAAVLSLVLMACGAAHAQAIYRCGTEYSQTPCPGGRILESSDPRSAAQRREAVRVAAQDRRRAAALERERRAMEKASKPATSTGFNGRPPPPVEPEPKAGKTSARPSKDAPFVAVEPAKPKQTKPK